MARNAPDSQDDSKSFEPVSHEPATTVHSDSATQSRSSSPSISTGIWTAGWLRGLYLLCGVIFPIGCLFALRTGIAASINDPWQSGQLQHYAAMMLTWPATCVFLPLIVISMIAMTTWCIKPALSGNFLVRVGVFSGVPLSFTFWILILLTSGVVSPIAAAITGAGLIAACWLSGLVIQKSKRFTIVEILIATTVTAIPAALIAHPGIRGAARDFIAAISFFILASTPTLNFIVYCVVGILVAKAGDSSQARLLTISSWLVWLTGAGATWKVAVEQMMIEYNKLPTSPPNCYVSAAAAHGHSTIVHSAPIQHNGRRIPVNNQMRRLKLLEFAIAASSPRLHRTIRRAYNRFGPTLARVCSHNPWFADLTYGLLLPLELFSELLRLTLGINHKLLRKIYRA